MRNDPQHTLEFTARARHGDPETSLAAAATITGEKMTKAMQAVLLAVHNSPVTPISDEELVLFYGHTGKMPFQTPQSIRSRRAQLVRFGYIAHIGFIVNQHGNKCRTWGVTDRGREYIATFRLDEIVGAW